MFDHFEENSGRSRREEDGIGVDWPCEQPRQLSCHRIQSTSRRAMYTPVTIFDIDHSLHFPLSLPYQMSHKYSTFILNALPSRQVESSFLAARIHVMASYSIRKFFRSSPPVRPSLERRTTLLRLQYEVHTVQRACHLESLSNKCGTGDARLQSVLDRVSWSAE